MAEIWVLTSEYNDYDQHGEYFIAAFYGKPSAADLMKEAEVSDKLAEHIAAGGGRIDAEYQWFYLRKYELAATGAEDAKK